MFWRKLCKCGVELLSDFSAFIVDAGIGKKRRNSVVKLYFPVMASSAK
jgi:hypothetical protein